MLSINWSDVWKMVESIKVPFTVSAWRLRPSSVFCCYPVVCRYVGTGRCPPSVFCRPRRVVLRALPFALLTPYSAISWFSSLIPGLLLF